jgi:hypothetical protein
VSKKLIPLPSNTLTILHQWATLIGIPAWLALGGWLLATVNGLQGDMIKTTVTLGFMQQDLGRHTTQLQEIDRKLGIVP